MPRYVEWHLHDFTQENVDAAMWLVSPEDIVRFQTAGWVRVAGMLPELAEPRIAGEVRQATLQTNKRYMNYSLAYLIRAYKLDCNNPQIVAECGVVDPEACLTEVGGTTAFKRLRCCVTAGNRKLRARGQKGVQANAERLRAQGYYDERVGNAATVTLPYYQNLHLHHHSEHLHTIATSGRLGRLAATLLQTEAVRLYQTALFVKSEDSQNAATSWHQDLVLVPLDTKAGGFLTFWCPIERPLNSARDSVLLFAEGTHRDPNLLYWYASPQNWEGLLKARYKVRSASHLELGDCTAHHGWVHHRASAQPKDALPRTAITFSYFTSEAMRLPDLTNVEGVRQRADRVFQFEDELSWRAWYSEVPDFQPVEHPLLPLVPSASHILHTRSHGTEKSEL